ncbi:MAG: zinc ABC transporter substrate-binding protein [Halohasta sp.]
MNLTRRRALKGSAGALALGSLAGCLDDVDASGGEFDSAYAAFFALADWSQAVAGDAATIENPVEYGQLGHGWEPDGDLPREVASTNAFVYLDTPEFSWAQDLASTLEADYETVAAVDALDGLESEMIENSHDHGGEADDEDDHGHENETEDDHTDEDDHGHEEDDADGHDDHEGEERGQLDPHVWVDPVLGQEMVDTIAAAFAEIDPDNSETFETNAAAYKERLAELDSQYQALVDDAETSTVVLASHSSFAYVEDRYGFDIHTVTGISPDAEPSNAEISETLDLVDEIGTDVILYDRFESDRLAKTIVDNTDATEAVPITAGAGTTSEWAAEGVDFIEQMEEVTLPAFGRALGAE